MTAAHEPGGEVVQLRPADLVKPVPNATPGGDMVLAPAGWLAEWAHRPILAGREEWARQFRWRARATTRLAAWCATHPHLLVWREVRPILAGLNILGATWREFQQCGPDQDRIDAMDDKTKAAVLAEKLRPNRARRWWGSVTAAVLLLGLGLWGWLVYGWAVPALALAVVLVIADLVGRRIRPVEDAVSPPPMPILVDDPDVPLSQLQAAILEVFEREGFAPGAVGVASPLTYDPVRMEYRVTVSCPDEIQARHLRAVERGIGAADYAVRSLGTGQATNRTLVIRAGDPLASVPQPSRLPSRSRSIADGLDLGATSGDVEFVVPIAGLHVAVIGKTGCLAGDTEVLVNRGGNARRYTIRQVVERFGGKKPIGRSTGHWTPEIPTFVQREVDGVLRLGRLLNAWSSGVKQTYTLTTTSGRSVRATAQHPFLTDDGWRKLGELVVGDRVMVASGQAAGRTSRKAQYRRRRVSSAHPHSVLINCRANGPFRAVETHRLVAEARLTGVPAQVFRGRVRAGDVAGLQFIDPGQYHVHHRDRDTFNNEPGNLEVLTISDHRREHADEGGLRRVLYKTADEEIVSIELFGEEETFDLEVADDPHNFIANGFVVHNSGKSKGGLWAVIDRLSVCHDAVIWGIDLAHGPALPMWRGVIQKAAYTVEDAEALLDAVLAEIDRRMRVLTELAEDDDPSNDTDEWHSGLGPALVIVVDEFALLAGYNGEKGRADLLGRTEVVVRTGRKVWVDLILGTQKSGNSDLGSTTMGSQIGAKILLACEEGDTVRLLGTEARDAGWAPHHLRPSVEGDVRDAGKCYIDSPRHRTPDVYRFWSPLSVREVKDRARQRIADGLPTLSGGTTIDAVEVPAVLVFLERAFRDAKAAELATAKLVGGAYRSPEELSAAARPFGVGPRKLTGGQARGYHLSDVETAIGRLS